MTSFQGNTDRQAGEGARNWKFIQEIERQHLRMRKTANLTGIDLLAWNYQQASEEIVSSTRHSNSSWTMSWLIFRDAHHLGLWYFFNHHLPSKPIIQHDVSTNNGSSRGSKKSNNTWTWSQGNPDSPRALDGWWDHGMVVVSDRSIFPLNSRNTRVLIWLACNRLKWVRVSSKSTSECLLENIMCSYS